MSSTGAGLSGNFPGIGDKSVDHPHADAQAVDFSQASTVVAGTVTNGEKAAEQNQKEGQIAQSSETVNSEHEGDSLHAVSEASSGRMSAGPAAAYTGDERTKDMTEDHKIEPKDASSENTSEAVESEKHDSVAASAGSSPPPSSAAPDELHMDTDAKEDSEEGDNKESGEVMMESGKDTDASKGDGNEKTDTEEGQGQVDKEGKKEPDTSDRTDDKSADTADKKDESAKRVLPKWMVQDADAPPSPKEADEKDVAAPATENAPASGGRGRGRGRRGRDTARAVAKPHNEATAEAPQAESLSSGRPRRSTRSNVDYAHPDVATVVAEQEDLENELQQKVTRSRGKGRGRGRGGRVGGRKRAAATSDDGEDSGSDYGSHKKQKRTTSGGVTRGRGRGRGRGRLARSAGRKNRKDESDDDDEEMDLSDNDAAGTPGSGGDGEEESYKPVPSKRRAAPEPQPSKIPPKKRGRAAAAKSD